MPTPTYLESIAPRFYAYRWKLGMVSILSWVAAGAFLLLLAIQENPIRVDPATIMLPFLFPFVWCWGLMLLGVWFHPTIGALRHGSQWLFHAPRLVETIIRYYAAFVLAVWFASPVFVLGIVIVGLV